MRPAGKSSCTARFDISTGSIESPDDSKGHGGSGDGRSGRRLLWLHAMRAAKTSPQGVGIGMIS